MNMYELILNIIDQKGPTSIPSICEEVNRNPIFMQQRSKPVQLSQIKSVLTRKSDLFLVHNVKVDFIKKDFTFFEWNFDPTKKLEYEPLLYGSMDEFKQEIYRLKIWNWDLNYEQEGIILDGMCWSISLETRTKTYKSQGLQTFPKEWARFCRALSKLTGKKFS